MTDISRFCLYEANLQLDRKQKDKTEKLAIRLNKKFFQRAKAGDLRSISIKNAGALACIYMKKYLQNAVDKTRS